MLGRRVLVALPHRLLQTAMNRRPVSAKRILECGVESAFGLVVKQLVDGLVALAPGRRRASGETMIQLRKAHAGP